MGGGAKGDHVVGVEFGVGFAAKGGFDLGAYEGHAGGAADEHDFVEVAGLEVRVGQGAAAVVEGLVDQRCDQRFEFGAGEGGAVVEA